MQRLRLQLALRLRRVIFFTARRINFRQKHPKAIVEFERVAVVRPHDARFLAALKIANLRAAGGERDKAGEQSEGAPNGHCILRLHPTTKATPRQLLWRRRAPPR